jgi:hypothetical protein|tara:strand:- start:2922 stop:3203 length:282 start_codon:yes stop_codon:yes gene_type:complete
MTSDSSPKYQREIGEIAGKLDALIRQVSEMNRKLDESTRYIARIDLHEQRIESIEAWRQGLWHRTTLMVAAVMGSILAIYTILIGTLKDWLQK